MKAETWQSISRLGMLAGIILTALAGYGSHHLGKVVERAKDAQAAEREKELRDEVMGTSGGAEPHTRR